MALLFEWHAENIDVTLGTPAGSSVGDTIATANSDVSLSATQAFDGNTSIKVTNQLDNYQFDWASSSAIVNPNAGTIDFMFYPETITGNQSIFEMRVDASNLIRLIIDTNRYLLLTHIAGGVSSFGRTTFPVFTAGGGWYRVKARWDITAHNTLYLKVTCDQTNGEGNSADNGTTALGTFAGSSGTVKFGDMVGANGVYYIDNIKIYDNWVEDLEVYYVDPSASGSTQDGTTENPYLSLNAALAGKCNHKLTSPVQIRCRTSGSVPDTTRAATDTLVSMVTTASSYLEIVAETGHRASASWDSTKYHLLVPYSVQAGTAIRLAQPHIRIDGLQIGISSQTGVAEIVYWAGGTITTESRLSNFLIKGINSSLQTRGLSTSAISAWNGVICDLGNHSGTVAVQTHENVALYNCTLISGGNIAVNNDGGDSIAKNCYAGGAVSECWNNEVGSTLTLTTCASSDTTGSAGLQNIAHSTENFINVTPGSSDYHLTSGSALRGVGTDTSGDASPFNFTTDIDNQTRGSWDIGADEYAVSPTITDQPDNATKSVGESVTFSVTATGDPTPTYQWRKDGVNISGATSADYTIASVVEADEGDYDCVVTNSEGSATSNVATLTVNSATSNWWITGFRLWRRR